jgi:hypothetical protein
VAGWQDGSGRALCAQARAVGRLKKSRRNREALHGDFYVSQANAFAKLRFCPGISIAILPADLPGSQGRESSGRTECDGVGIENRNRRLRLGSCRTKDRVTVDQQLK